MTSRIGVDWQVWQHIPEAKLWEAVALSQNVEPRSIKINPHSWMGSRLIFEEPKQFTDRLLVAERNLTSGQLRALSIIMGRPTQCTISLSQFATWALSIGWDIPPELARMAKTESTSCTEEASVVEKPLTTRERNNVARVIAALTQAAKIDLSDPYKAAKAIEALTEQLDARVSDDTIVKWLKEAAAVLGKEPR